jgi:cytidyltransferase-like protein
MKTVAVTGSFDNLRSKHVRLLQEAAKCGSVHVGLWSDETVQEMEGQPPRFPERERLYLLQALRYVDQVTIVRGAMARDELPKFGGVKPDIWVVDEASDSAEMRAGARAANIELRGLSGADPKGFSVPAFSPPAIDSGRQRVLVTGCFDWLHSGHVRFFEEASAWGELYVVVGHDANIALLKGTGHPLLGQAERLYMVHSVRYVHQAMISTGRGWMDAEPEIAKIKPHIYIVNEDGNNPEKRAFSAEHGIEYIVLKRIPKEGLPQRESTLLRGF